MTKSGHTGQPGQKMLMALQFIDMNTGCSKRAVARWLYAAGQERRGYLVVNRCIAAGLVYQLGEVTRRRLYLTAAGMGTLRSERARWQS